MARKWLPDNVTEWTDRHGKKRYRFRKVGLPSYNFRNPPGSPGFMEELAQAQAAVSSVASKAAPYSYAALIESFYRTAKWLNMKPSSQRTYRSIIERFRAKNGDKDARFVTAAAIEAKLATMTATPAAANNLRKTLARLHRHAIRLGWRTDNPVEATDPMPTNRDGFHTWTEAEIAQFEATWAIGTRERLAMGLMLYTALRRSDVIRLGPQHRKDGAFRIRPAKTDRHEGAELTIPILPQLAEILDATPCGHLTYLCTMHGQPYTVDGFGNWFRRKCAKAGLPHCSPHGLRKAMTRRLAEAGVTHLQGRAVTGHKSDRLFSHYAAKADQARLAGDALATFTRKFAKPTK